MSLISRVFSPKKFALLPWRHARSRFTPGCLEHSPSFEASLVPRSRRSARGFKIKSASGFGTGMRLSIGFGFRVLLMLLLTQQSVSRVNEINDDLGKINDVISVKQRFAINFRGKAPAP
ncbi:MAG TPA: hypothetical protein VL202_16230 [Pararhizobium sp.]|uniref:hypothetical protein n=1 Tax=Pararhizobium sp. TaxID=1977563 RepID=UPI002BE0E1EF|nr:hypothetical protein [Pararhizobium sp.]HTO32707.1 hypothetical protein [Pararhizobium sp.]